MTDFENKKHKNNSDKEIGFSELTKLFSIVIGLWILSLILVYYIFNGWNNGAAFGDSFGAINALFSGLAFAGIIYTIFLQRRELHLQRLELNATRAELKRSADAQKESERAFRKQAASQKITAQLTALSTLLEAYTKAEENFIKHNITTNLDLSKREQLIKQIEILLLDARVKL